MNASNIETAFSAGIEQATGRVDRPMLVTAPAKNSSRIVALDFTKGALVLVMVLYHWLNYFVVADGSVYKYLRFLTPSFIFITGFLISHLYLSKHQSSGPRIARKLLLRGLKLLGLVLALNVALSTLRPKGLAARISVGSPGEVLSAYFTGTASVSFSVLVPIAYLLIFSAGVLLLPRHYRSVCYVACACFVTCAFLSEWNNINSGYLEIFSMGTVGLSVGFISIDRINGFASRWLTVLFAYLLYLAAITLWDVFYLLQVVGVCLSLAIIYWLGTDDAEPIGIRKIVILLGQYSLFAYILQILILQVLHPVLRFLGTGIAVSGVALLACAGCTMLGVEAMQRARPRMTGLNKLYTAVFS